MNIGYNHAVVATSARRASHVTPVRAHGPRRRTLDAQRAQSESREELVVITDEPFNAETPLGLQTGMLTPVRRFYVRNHFAVPREWSSLVVDGSVKRTLSLTLDDLRSLPARSVVATLECAGNGRSLLSPPVSGTPWTLGAVGTADWTGPTLKTVLETAGVADDAVEVLFEGADSGTPQGQSKSIPFARSLPLEKALDETVLLAYAMNGEPLTPDHGAPLRLVVPGWYGMASVKWLAHIEVLQTPFLGYYQSGDYVMDRDGKQQPLAEMEVRSIITWPAHGEQLPRGVHTVRGYCWSGRAPISKVEVSADGGSTWKPARVLSDSASEYAWRMWDFAWEPPTQEEFQLVCRASDAAGNAQTVDQVWNRMGYANNACHVVGVVVL